MDTCRKFRAILDNVSVEEQSPSLQALRALYVTLQERSDRDSPIEKHAVRANRVAPLGDVWRSPASVVRLH
jgi:hypothetical protein